MYKSSHFTEQDGQKVIAFIKANPFAIITGMGDIFPVASHIPIAVEEKDGRIFLHGHLMKKTDHHLAFEKNNSVLAIFSGPHCYVSASWYSTPLMGSTWNYMTVHAKGKMIFADEAGTIAIVKKITETFEGTDTISSFDKLSDEYVDAMVKAIVGFTIEVESLDNVFKLSQNRDKASKQNIIAQLINRGDHQSLMVAEEMKKQDQ